MKTFMILRKLTSLATRQLLSFNNIFVLHNVASGNIKTVQTKVQYRNSICVGNRRKLTLFSIKKIFEKPLSENLEIFVKKIAGTKIFIYSNTTLLGSITEILHTYTHLDVYSML